MTRTRRLRLLAVAVLGAVLFTGAPGGQTLRIGLQDDPDKLDPALTGTLVGHMVLLALCDKLVDIDPQLNLVPMLATRWVWSEDGRQLTLDLRDDVVFHDGTKFDADAVKFNVERYLKLKGSLRSSELKPVEHVTVESPTRVTLITANPFVPLVAALAERAGMMISPAAAREADGSGQGFATHPVCSGGFKFRERVAQDRIVIDRFDKYWNKGAIRLASVVYRPIPDQTVRLANLQSGDLDLIERLSSRDIATVRSDPNLRLQDVMSLGYRRITINLGNGPNADNPLGRSAKVREALELSIDRDVVNQVTFNNEFAPDNQPLPLIGTYRPNNPPIVPPRDVERSRALLKEAGLARVPIELMMPNDSDSEAVGEVIQAMAADAGFDIKLAPMELAAAFDRERAGDFQAFYIGWSGRVDPDGNTYPVLAKEGTYNFGKYDNSQVTVYLTSARKVADLGQRKEFYASALNLVLADRPIIYLYHMRWMYGVRSTVQEFTPYPDGVIRVAGVIKQE